MPRYVYGRPDIPAQPAPIATGPPEPVAPKAVDRTKLPNCWGYSRTSTIHQDMEAKAHVAAIEAYATSPTNLERWNWRRCRVDGATSARKTSFYQRAEATKLMAEMQSGDHLVVTKLDRLGRSTIDILTTLRDLDEGGIIVHALQYGDAHLDMDTTMGRAMAGLLALVAQVEGDLIADRTREAFAYRKSVGLLVGGRRDRLGYTYHRLPPTKEYPRGELVFDRDENECAHVLEIYNRHMNGETFQSIAEDFCKRKLRRANGNLWVSAVNTLTESGTVSVAGMMQMSKTFNRYRAILERGESL